MLIADSRLELELGVGYVLILPFWIAAIGVLTGRVLGMSIGRWRMIFAASVGWLVGLVGGVVALGPKHVDHPGLVIVLSVFFGVLAALPVAIVVDVVTRGRRGRPGRGHPLRHPLRSTRMVLAPLQRFREVVGYARSENLLHVRYRNPAALASPDLARRVRVVLERSGGMFVKFGQIAATRTDLLPDTLTSELSNLHSNVARVSAEEVMEVVRSELGEPVEHAFAEFEQEPMAAASIGQVHRARLHDGQSVVLLAAFSAQILRDGYYHADPHPGNVLIDADGVLWLLDFGAVGRVDPITREALLGLAMGFTLKDGTVLARAVRYLVGDDQIDMRELERDLAVLLGEVTEGGLSPAAIAGVMDVMEQHGMRPPRSMLLLSRTLLTLEGTLRTIDPGFKVAVESQEIVGRDLRAELARPEDLVRREVVKALPALRTLPEHAEALASQWRSGRLTLRTERYAGRDRWVLDAWLNRALVMLVGAAGGVTSAGLLIAGSLSTVKDVRDALWVVGFSGLTLAAMLLMRTAAQALHSETVHADEDGSPPAAPNRSSGSVRR